MASYRRSYPDDQRRSQFPKMSVKQGTLVVEPHAGAQNERMGEDVDFPPKIDVEVQVKKEQTEEKNQNRCDASSPSFLYEVQTSSSKDNGPRLSEETNLAEIKEERRDASSLSFDDNYIGETKETERDFEEITQSAERRRSDVSRDGDKIHDTSSPNQRKDSKQANKKRKLYELYAEELSLRNDLRNIHPTSHGLNFEARTAWHQARNEERKTPQNDEKIAYAQYISKMHADPDSTFKRMGIYGMPPDYHLRVDGTRTSDPIHKNTPYLPQVDPQNREFFIRDEPRTEQTYRSLPEELLSRTWHPKYEVLFANPASSEAYSKNDLKSSKQSKKDDGPHSKERFERHFRLQEDLCLPYFDRSVGRGDVYEKQGVSFLRVEHPEERRHNQTKPYHAFSTDRRPESRPSTAECVQYVPVSNMLIPTPKPEFLLNGLSNTPFDFGAHTFPLADKGSLAFIDKEKVFYPCCNEEIPTHHYDSIRAKARWFDTRHAERQRFDAFQALRSVVTCRENNVPQAMFLEDRARMIEMNDLGCQQNNSPLEERERFKVDVPLPTYASGMQHQFSKKFSSAEETVTAAERDIRRIGGDRTRKDAETSTAWQEKGSRTSCKETLENRTWNVTKEARTEMLKNEETEESRNKQKDMSQEGTTALPDAKNSETQPKFTGENQDDCGSKKTISCSVCKKTFNRTSNLYTHMRTHSSNKPHACEFCGKRFHQKADLRIHRYIHTGEKPHKCTKCGRGFKQLTHLKYHMRTHSDVRMYKCPYCEKGFNQKSNLQAHIFGHTGQRPHKCETCGKGFTLASTLNTHKRTHLPSKPFKCEFCDRAFYQKNALKMHYVSTHPYSSGVCLA